MKRNNKAKRLAAAALALVLVLALAACGGQKDTQKDTLKGIYEALTAPDSDYSRNKALYQEFYPELEYGETLGDDRITITLKANGNEYFTDSTWDFVRDGDWLTLVIPAEDYTGAMQVIYMARAIGSYYGMDPALVNGYLNGLSILEIESDSFVMTQDAAAGSTTYKLNIASPWEMQELDQMILDERVLDAEPLDDSYTSQGGNVGKLLYLANGNAAGYTVLLAEYGELDDAAYQSIVNLVTLRKPAGYEAFLAEFTELKALETEDYAVVLNPDDETVAEIMGERNEKYSYVLLRFGSEEYGEEEFEIFAPSAEEFADSYFRLVAELPQGTAGSSLAAATCACDVLAFAVENELWLADVATLRANMLEAWESLTDEERANFDASFIELNALLNSCFEDWDANRGRFEDAGVAEAMEALMADAAAQESWNTLSANTWTLGNSEG